MFSKRILIIGCVIIALALATVFGMTSTARSEDDQATAVTLLMNEYTFQVQGQQLGDPLTLTAGQPYKLTIKNTGTLVHEIWFGKDTMIQEGHVDGYSKGLFDGVDMAVTSEQGTQKQEVEIDSKALYEIALNPGQTVTLGFTLPDTTKGDWEIGCFQMMPTATSAATTAATAVATRAATADPNATPTPGVTHYNVGMKLKLTVK